MRDERRHLRSGVLLVPDTEAELLLLRAAVRSQAEDVSSLEAGAARHRAWTPSGGAPRILQTLALQAIDRGGWPRR